MQRLKILALACLAAFALSAVASASASAAPCTVKKEGFKKTALCIEGQAATTSAEVLTKLASATAVLQLPAGLSESGSDICKKVTGTGLFESSEEGLLLHFGEKAGSTNLTWSECHLEGNEEVKACLLPATQLFEATTSVFRSDEQSVMARNLPAFTVTTLVFKNNNPQTCPTRFAGQKPVSGNYECKLHEPTLEAIEHEYICVGPSNQFGLKIFGEKTPIHYTQKISLGGENKGKKFSVYES